MLVQDSRTGYFHEAPDYNVSGYAGYAGQAGQGGYGQVLYDGLGNPVGIFGPLLDMFKGAVSSIPIVGGLVNKLIPGSSPAQAPPALPFPIPTPQGLSNLVSNVLPGGPPSPSTFPVPGGSPFPGAPPAPWPYRWIRPQGPLMAGHRRMYLRCTAWPGPEGLVPVDAATPGLQPPTPGAPIPGGPAGRGFHRRGRHRRRR